MSTSDLCHSDGLSPLYVTGGKRIGIIFKQKNDNMLQDKLLLLDIREAGTFVVSLNGES